MSEKGTTMTIGHVSMSPRPEVAEAIRSTCDKYKIPISTLMQAMLTPQLPNIEEFAKTIVAERKAKEQEIRDAQATKTGGYALDKEVQSLTRRYEHTNLVNEARFQNLSDDLNNIEKNIDKLSESMGRLLAMWEDKPIIGQENNVATQLVLEPIDSSAWGS